MLRRTFLASGIFAWFMKPVLGKIVPEVKPKTFPPGLHLVPIEYLKIDEKCSVRALDEYSIRELSKSILLIGLKNPITVSPDGTIIDGQHRFLACKRLKMKQVQCHVCMAESIHLSDDMWIRYSYRC